MYNTEYLGQDKGNMVLRTSIPPLKSRLPSPRALTLLTLTYSPLTHHSLTTTPTLPLATDKKRQVNDKDTAHQHTQASI